jgi:16S rRNA G1207 methylase RsmC
MKHYYSEHQDSGLKLYDLDVRLRGMEFTVASASGVFSSRKVDKGTELLVDRSILKEGWKVLDLGCGCGVVGITTAKAYPGTEVVMSDINRRAIKVSEMNIKNLGIENAETVQSDTYENISGRFDTILLNPPQSAGKKLCFGMIEGAKEHLKRGGLLQLVARHNKGGKALSEKMEEVFGNVKDVAKKGGFRVYVSEN